jgi:hypothetical protein
MTDLVIPVDVESLLIDYLTAELAFRGEPVPVADELLAGDRTECVAVYRTGSSAVGRLGTVTAAQITVDAKGATKTRSTRLINLAVALTRQLAGSDLGGYGVNRVTEIGGGQLPSGDAPTRYTANLIVEIQAQIV